MNNDPSWVPGNPGHTTLGNGYAEDMGRGSDGHLVVVNDTRVTIDDAYSFHPSIGLTCKATLTSLGWMDATMDSKGTYHTRSTTPSCDFRCRRMGRSSSRIVDIRNQENR